MIIMIIIAYQLSCCHHQFHLKNSIDALKAEPPNVNLIELIDSKMKKVWTIPIDTEANHQNHNQINHFNLISKQSSFKFITLIIIIIIVTVNITLNCTFNILLSKNSLNLHQMHLHLLSK